MSIARGSTLKNGYRYVTLAIEDCPGRQPCGMLYHATRDKGVAFSGYLELVWEADAILQGQNYPMRSVEQRTFSERRGFDKQRSWKLPETDMQGWKTGRKATFQLFVTHRFYGSWQGNFLWVEKQKTFEYRSFLELMHLMNEILSEPEAEPEPITDSVIEFSDMSQLVERLDVLFSLPDGGHRMAIGLYRRGNKTETFVIRLLFRGNATWQGSICWKETGQRRHFRSFLELIMMIDEGVLGSVGWSGKELSGRVVDL